MSALELADLIGLCGDGGYNLDAAVMLRYQANQIDILKAQLSYLESKVYGGTTK
jgi:hypothetical protein